MEFALILPFLILIIFCVLDFAILAFDKAVLTDASREAVRSAIALTPPTPSNPTMTWSTSAIAMVACNYTRSTLITVSTGTRTNSCSGTADPVITVTPTTMPAFGEPVTVTVSYAVNGFSLGSWLSLGTGPSSVGSALTLTSSSQMRHE